MKRRTNVLRQEAAVPEASPDVVCAGGDLFSKGSRETSCLLCRYITSSISTCVRLHHRDERSHWSASKVNAANYARPLIGEDVFIRCRRVGMHC